MNRYSFTYLVVVYLLFGIYTLNGEIDIDHQLKAALVLMSFFGIPHGAIDNVLFLSKHKMPQPMFYSLYLSTIAVYCCFWYFFPIFSLLFFFLISAFHFGESQLSDYAFQSRFKKAIYTLWGVFLLSTLVFYNQSELLILCQEYTDTVKFGHVFEHPSIDYLFYGSNVILITFLCLKKYRDNHKTQDLLTELFQLFLIHLTFYLFPLVISFNLYFIFIHSMNQFWLELVNFIPKLLIVIVVLFLGWLLAKLVRTAVKRVLVLVQFDKFSEKSGLEAFMTTGDANITLSGIISQVMYWLVIIVSVTTAANYLGLTEVVSILRDFAAYLPRIIVAILVMIFGTLLARFINRLVFAWLHSIKFENALVVSTTVEYGIQILALFVALEQLGIGVQLINSLFIIVFGAVFLALALAFGLGGREWAAKTIEEATKKDNK